MCKRSPPTTTGQRGALRILASVHPAHRGRSIPNSAGVRRGRVWSRNQPPRPTTTPAPPAKKKKLKPPGQNGDIEMKSNLGQYYELDRDMFGHALRDSIQDRMKAKPDGHGNTARRRALAIAESQVPVGTAPKENRNWWRMFYYGCNA